MQANDHYIETTSPYAHQHRYTSSSEFSLGGIKSNPMSESGTSHTHYDDTTPPPPKVTMDAYTQLTGGAPNGVPSRQPSQRSEGMLDPQDPTAMRALVERAAEESENFEVLTIEDFEKSKRDHSLLERRIDGLRQKLQYEAKIRDAAKRMAKLDPSSSHQEDLAEGMRKVGELSEELYELERERAATHSKILMHSAGVLQMQHRMQRNGAATPVSRDEEDYRAGLHDTADGIMDITELGGPANPELQHKLQGLTSAMYYILNDPGMRSSPEYPPPPPEGAGDDAYLAYMEDGLDTVKELYQELMRYVQETQSSHEQTNNVMSDLWRSLDNGEKHIRSQRMELQAHPNYDPSTDRGLEDLDNAPLDEEFSHEAFSAKVQRLCTSATALSERQLDLHHQMKSLRENDMAKSSKHSALVEQLQDAHDQQLQTQKAFDDTKSQLAEVNGELGELRSELSFTKQQKEALETNQGKAAENEKSLQDSFHQISQLEQERNDLESERSNFEAEVVRLQTELTVTKAELDAAYGTRAERAAEAAAQGPDLKQELVSEVKKREEVEARVDTLQRELREMVSEYEGLVRQGVETERERELLENMNDSLREKNEELTGKVAEERIKWMGRKASADESASNGNANLSVKDAANTNKQLPILEATTMRVMREEFKKMMREARADHFKALRVEQEERRKLESTIRSIRKEQNHIAAQTAGAGSSTLSPVTKKSGLSQSVTAD